jgi:cbb3-type cytochrome oxidase maturation protein
MSIILVLIPLSILFAVAFLAAFIWAVRSGQYEDTCTPAMRLLAEDDVTARLVKAPDHRRLADDSRAAVASAEPTGVQTMPRSDKPNSAPAS